MIRTATATLVLALATCVAGCAKVEQKTAYRRQLNVGDPAPPLTATRWLNGDPVARFEPGKVYVLDFWATWCGPCLRAMPHLAELAREHEAAGLVVIPVTTVGGRNSLKSVEDYVGANGPQLGLRFAVCEDRRMEDAWFEAAGRGGIPCSFVVDRNGKIAYIGHPMEVDGVLTAVLAGAGPNDAK